MSGVEAGTKDAKTHHPVVLFDGVCNLCHASIDFIIPRDSRCTFRFASLQGASGRAMLEKHHLSPEDTDTLILIEDGRFSVRSTAALRIAARLRFPWPLLSILLLVPRPIRDSVYRIVARNRYRWFGRMNACRAPSPELRTRFLE